VDAFLPPFVPVQLLDPAKPITIGALVGPEAFMEVKALAHQKVLRALELIPTLATQFEARFGRASGGLVRPYRSEDADTIVVALGSVNGTIQEVVDAMRDEGRSVGSLDVCTFRPFPFAAVRKALMRATRVIVLEKNIAVGMGGVLASDVRDALGVDAPPIHTVIAGLGGRAITRASVRRAIEQAQAGTLEPLHFLDLDGRLVEREVAKEVHS
jgi:pyruvate ferredoxin oxidoreductase alpha subunit